LCSLLTADSDETRSSRANSLPFHAWQRRFMTVIAASRDLVASVLRLVVAKPLRVNTAYYVRLNK